MKTEIAEFDEIEINEKGNIEYNSLGNQKTVERFLEIQPCMRAQSKAITKTEKSHTLQT